MRPAAKLERALLALGLGAAALAAAPAIVASLAQRGTLTAVAASQTRSSPSSGSDGVIVPASALATTYGSAQDEDPANPHIIGDLTMPALSLAAPIVSGIEPNALSRGVGHVPGSAYAGGLGNMAVAGHRDTFFRPLRDVKPGMAVLVDGPGGKYLYRVNRTEIVTPDNLRILNIGSHPELTLITCYPFNFLGSAPKRFIVHASLVSAASQP